MTLTLSPDRLRSSSLADTRRLRIPGWEIYVASAGSASATTTAVVGPTSEVSVASVVLGEADGGTGDARGGAVDRGVEGCPLVELRLEPSGHVVARCHQGPPVLLVSSPNLAGPLPVSGLGTTVHVDPGRLLLAVSPAVLDATAPAEVLVAPKLLWMTPDPACLLRRWVETATRRGLPGAAAAVARRTRSSRPARHA